MKRFVFLLIVILFVANAQNCINTAKYGEFDITENTVRNEDIILSPCSTEGQYIPINGVQEGFEFIFKIDVPLQSSRITLRRDTNDGEVLATGIETLNYVSTFNGTIYVLWNHPSDCSQTGSNCKRSTIQIVKDCYFAPYTRISLSNLRRCLNAIPLSEATKNNTITQVRDMVIKFYPLRDLLFVNEGLNFVNEINRIQNTQYTNEFSFYLDIYLLLSRIPNTYFNLPNHYNLISKRRPISFSLPINGSSNLYVTPESLYFDTLTLNLDDYKKSGDLESINGIPFLDYIANADPSLNHEDRSTRYNINLRNLINNPSFYRLHPESIFNQYDLYKFADGTEIYYEAVFYTSSPLFTGVPTNQVERRDTDKSFAVDQVGPKDWRITTNRVLSSSLSPKDIQEEKIDKNQEWLVFAEKSSKNNEENKAPGRRSAPIKAKRDFEESFGTQLQRGLFYRSTDGLAVPYLRIFSFSNNQYDVEDYKSFVLRYVNSIINSNATVSILDVQTEGGQDGDLNSLLMAEWVVGILTGNYPRTAPVETPEPEEPVPEFEEDPEKKRGFGFGFGFNRNTIGSSFYNVAFNARITDDLSKQYLNATRNSYIDPTSGRPFTNFDCILNNPITEKRGYTREQFSNIMFAAKTISYPNLPRFRINYHVVTTGVQSFAGGIFIQGLSDNGAKVFGLGGIDNRPFAAYLNIATDVRNWDLFNLEIQNPNYSPLDGTLTFGYLQYFRFARYLPRFGDDDDYDHYNPHHDDHHDDHGDYHNDNHHDNNNDYDHDDHYDNHHNDDHYGYHHDNHYDYKKQQSQKQTEVKDKKGSDKGYFTPAFYLSASTRYVDQVISWSQIPAYDGSLSTDLILTFDLISSQSSTFPRRRYFLPTFCTKRRRTCYSRGIPCPNK